MAAYESPTGRKIIDVIEVVRNIVAIDGIDEKGEPIYGSAGGDVDWDSQVPLRHAESGHIVYLDEAGDEWPFDKLNKIGEDD